MRLIWFSLGGLALLLGALGVFLPVLPTTPFIILAAFAFGKSSPRLHAWLVANPLFGPMIVEWETHGSIPVKVKTFACLMMAAVFIASFAFGAPHFVLTLQAIGLGLGAAYVLSRPSGPSI